MVYYDAISSYMSGSDIFGQWSWCKSSMNEITKNNIETSVRPKILNINWSYNIFQIGENFYISGAWCGEINQFVKIPLPGECTELNKIKDLLVVGNDYKLVLVSKSTNTIWIINLNTKNEIDKVENNIIQQDNNGKKIKMSDNILKVALVNDSCLYLTSSGNVYNGIKYPSNVDTRHCTGQISDIQCGYEHYVLLTDTGLVYTWGNGRRLQLGHGDVSNLELPTEVEALAGIRIVKIACGGWHSFALSESGDLYTWGWNDTGQLGIKCEKEKLESFHVPTLVDLFDDNEEQVMMNVKDVACGSRHSAILLEDNSVWTTGYNKYGQLGHSEEQYPKITYFKKAFDREANFSLLCGPWTTVLIKE